MTTCVQRTKDLLGTTHLGKDVRAASTYHQATPTNTYHTHQNVHVHVQGISYRWVIYIHLRALMVLGTVEGLGEWPVEP